MIAIELQSITSVSAMTGFWRAGDRYPAKKKTNGNDQ
jgi:hypothetical protein